MKILCPQCDQFQKLEACLSISNSQIQFICTRCAHQQSFKSTTAKAEAQYKVVQKPTQQQPAVIVGALLETPANTSTAAHTEQQAITFDFPVRNEKEKELLDQFNLLYRGDWHNEKKHRALIQTSNLIQCLPLAGQVYRHALNLNTNDQAAQNGQERILTIAMSTMTQALTPQIQKNTGPNISYKKWILILGMIGISLFSLMTILKNLKGLG